METYFKKKKALAEIILKHITNPTARRRINKIMEEYQIIEL